MPVKQPAESRRPLRPTARTGGGTGGTGPSSGTGSSASASSGGTGSSAGGAGGAGLQQSGAGGSSGSSSSSSHHGGVSGGVSGGSSGGGSGGGGGHHHNFNRGLGRPDVYPQEKEQKEDELTAVHVKHGFTQSYSAHVSDEYASAASRAASLTIGKVLAELRGVQGKKEEANTLPDTGRRRQSLNTKDHFWLVTGRNKAAVDAWLKDLSGPRPLSWLAKRVPVFNKREELLTSLCDNEVPLSRAVWFIKMTAAYAMAMQETNKKKGRPPQDPSQDWTSALVRFLKDQLAELNNLAHGASSLPGLVQGLPEDSKPEKSHHFKYWSYGTSLCELMYHQGLLDRQEFLQWILDSVEKCRHPEDPVMKLILPLVLEYTGEFVKSEVLSRKLAYQCAKKITVLVNDTDSISGGSGSSNTAGAGGAGGAASGADASAPSSQSHPHPHPHPHQHPVMSAFLELMEDSGTRFLILGLSSVVQMITLECPTSLVWYSFGENKTPSALNGSPLDFLPNSAPSGLPMPPRQNNQAIRHRIKQAESVIKERSMAAEGKQTLYSVSACAYDEIRFFSPIFP